MNYPNDYEGRLNEFCRYNNLDYTLNFKTVNSRLKCYFNITDTENDNELIYSIMAYSDRHNEEQLKLIILKNYFNYLDEINKEIYDFK